MKELYLELEKIINKIDFDALWPGFKRIDFSIFNDTCVYLKNEIIQRDERFLANTVIDFSDKPLAIWHIEKQENINIIELAGNLVHEMFHAFQVSKDEKRYPDELKFLQDVTDISYYQMLKDEITNLISGLDNKVVFEKYLGLKEYRYQKFPEVVKNELFAETIEGTAEFVGLKAMKQLSLKTYHAQLDGYISYLQKDKNLFNRRKLSYFIGALQFLCLETHKFKYSYKITEKTKSTFEQIKKSKLIEPKIEVEENIEQLFNKHLENKKKKIEKFMNKKLSEIECYANLCGYDPMNMIEHKSYILCTNFAVLCGVDKKLIEGPVLLKIDENYNVNKYFIKETNHEQSSD